MNSSSKNLASKHMKQKTDDIIRNNWKKSTILVGNF